MAPRPLSFLATFVVTLIVIGGASPASAQSNFTRGDCNTDGAENVADIVFLLGALFSGGTTPTCQDACDFNDDGSLNIADAIRGLNFLFTGGDLLPPPIDNCGPDPTPDSISCLGFPPCQALDPEICENGVDDDFDGAVDCDDTDCLGEPTCTPITLAVDIQPIWDANCVSCHAAPLPAAGLDLTPAAAFAQLVGVPSVECSMFDRVDPGSPQSSWLFRKIEGSHTTPGIVALGCSPATTGGQMPLGPGCCLDPQTIELIEMWIFGGAQP